MKRFTLFMMAASLSLAAHAVPSDSIHISKLEETQQLGEVVVKSNLPKIRNNANGMTCIIQGSELEKVGNSKDVLSRLPSIQKADDGVEVFGRGAAEVYVNNRKLYDLKELEHIPSDQITSVEIFSSRTLYQENRYYTRLELTATYKFNLANNKYKGGKTDEKQRKRME